MSEGIEGPAPAPEHLYDAVSSQKERVVGGFAEQRDALARAVEEQRLAAMPEHLRAAAISPSARASAEIVQMLQRIIAREVTRQLDLAVSAMIAQAAPEASEEPPPN